MVRTALAALAISFALSIKVDAADVAPGDTERQRGAVATVNPLATQAGLDAMQRGGNAIDAAVAAALTLGVVDGHNSGIGGGCFVLIRRSDGTLYAIDGRETAPFTAHRDMYLRDGQADPRLSKVGALASGTPGAVAALARALREHGTQKLPDLLLPAADIAERGFSIDRVYARNLRSTASDLQQFEASRKMLLKSNGEPYVEGDVLRLPDLAKTYRAIASEGVNWFYRGPFAAAVENWMQSNGGLLSRKDFAAYQAKARVPLQTQYRGYTIIGFPPPSSGGIHVGQILNILENFDLRGLAAEDPAKFHHVIVEAMKLAFADRAHWLGDADFARVPRGLIDRAYAAQLAAQIDPDRATTVASHGMPPGHDGEWFGDQHTTHVAAADAAGNWVALTATVNTSFGSKVVVPQMGVVLNNEMDDFSSQPGVPNAFGLLGAEANAIAPQKRPLSSMSPTIVLKDDRPVLTIGAAGGPTIITQVVLGIVRFIDLEQPLETAVAGPRFHHQWSPDRVLLENRFPNPLAQALEARGHALATRSTIGVTQAIASTPGGFVAVHDPRVPGMAKAQ